ncbi:MULTISPECIES: LacI family DNA-binding transcriptional regulator [unclassified Mesorhizobium]|uniref:LacI family DNA-binding transcriptional regulator n=1 Tax=unclassified Mesorhizobium TaxID=325217 RepID=UPI0011294BAF|nr:MULTISPECIES: LacI family DNA-binding transcriptional regulator [unclassified Mesorhizobium]MBZ9684393.1 LacI family transcriptional regulator [Mesorhizobium sp. CO1-1-2]MBZ9926712.1 LacI family transcriptional regulator [Mesorhizobium sp. BR1-1-4]TPK71931.1 LacI family transcriptional regulator [Mesorhizobium sp. B2-4-18]
MASDDQPVPVFPKPVTLRDVAARAGVSVATASKALNDQGRMTAETRERIRETARNLGFRPNSLAQSLLRRRSFTVGLLTNDTYGRFSLPLMSGISDALVDAGVSVFLCNVEEDPRLGQLHVEAMLDKRVDGIIATGKRIDRHLPIDLANLRIPVIYAFTQPDPDAVAFVSDDAGGARLAVDHFCRLGRKRIAHVTGPASFAVVHERAQAYRAALIENGLSVIEPLLGAWSEAWGHEAVTTLFDGGGEKPDAVFCGNDQIARGVIDALRERGLSVPGDVGVIGFDNWEIVAEATRPPLTSVDMNLTALGREAGLTLLSLVGGKPAAPGIRKLPCRLVVRQSCGRLPDG